MSDCPHTDDVLATFLDGAAGGDDPALAAHRDACAICRRALDRTRALDALLAAQTRTDADDALADRVLAFDAAVPTGRGRRVTIALAAGAAAVLAVAVWPSRTPPPTELAAPDAVAAVTEPPREPESYRAPRAIPSPSSLQLVADAWRPAASRAVPSAEVWITGAAGGPADADAYRDVARRAERLVGPAGDREPSALRVAAARWLAAEADGGRLASRRLWGVGELLVRSDGRLRASLVRAFREERSLQRLLDRRLPGRHGEWGARDRMVAAAIGATGARARLDRVRSAPVDVVASVIASARATGDRVASDFAVALACDLFQRGAVARETVVEWLACAAPDGAWLTRALTDRVHTDRREPTRDLCRAVLTLRQSTRPGVL